MNSDGFDTVSEERNLDLDNDESVDDDPPADDTEEITDVEATEIKRIEELLVRVRETEIRSAPRNSLAAFSRMTGENPWLPFLDDNRDPRAIAERKLFNEMKSNYDRHVSPSTPVRGYDAFSREWCDEVGQRYLARLAGVVDQDTDVTVIYSKTAQQLANYFDKLEAEAQVATVLNTPEAVGRQRDLNRIIRNSRQTVVTPTVVPVGPVRYQCGPNQQTPLGVPLVLNTSIAFPSGFLPANLQSVGGAAPFLLPNLNAQQQIPTCPPKGTYRKICQHCGRLRTEHHSAKEFGKKNCKFIRCARCLQPHRGMGLACKAITGPGVRVDDLVAYDTKIKGMLHSR